MFLFAFVGYEKPVLGKVKFCDPSLALGACASELGIVRVLVVDNVVICFHVLSIPHFAVKVKVKGVLFLFFFIHDHGDYFGLMNDMTASVFEKITS